MKKWPETKAVLLEYAFAVSTFAVLFGIGSFFVYHPKLGGACFLLVIALFSLRPIYTAIKDDIARHKQTERKITDEECERDSAHGLNEGT